jgi:MFS family permease
VAAPALLAFFRFGQGLGLGGEWGGAVLLAIENAPPGKRAWYGMFPQLGAPADSFFPEPFFWRSRDGSPTRSFSPSGGAFRFWPAPLSCLLASTCG